MANGQTKAELQQELARTKQALERESLAADRFARRVVELNKQKAAKR